MKFGQWGPRDQWGDTAPRRKAVGPDAAAPYDLGSGERKPNLHKLRITVSVTDALRGELNGFLKRCVAIMCAADEDGADGATRCFAVLRPLQIRLARETTQTLRFELTYHGAKSCVRDMGSFLERYTEAHALAALRASLHSAMQERDKVSHESVRRRPPTIREKRRMG